ncbi:glycosyltransferase [Ethanoligenens harbinense]|uniref:Glycosyl transferase family 2 n=1 Tax=Ethanoligenens harbinense (strain DSM 18485 / JCM 12961 / CGMCC 1.5033 / YUAN-3) TaxID=663278 RepID=E6U6H0_ETHHY|nr:glycosyltransferase [Ethanoligenens harbinense]ADU28040.1 glycosyl transferase family 2 [Ethanoligenens harbinense YUAN-3]
MKAYTRKKGDVKISACTIAKNEAKNIARCINSYKEFVDEIIVVDTGSTDDTVRIAEECGATVLHFDWCDDFSAAKNFAIEAASGDWIICLDADQYFSENCGTQVRRVIENAERKGKNCVMAREVNLDDASGRQKSEVGVIRIFRAGLRYRFPIHESIFSPQGLEIATVPKLQFFYYHTGYSSDRFEGKLARNLRLLQKELETHPEPTREAALHAYMCDCYSGMNRHEETRAEARAYLEGRRKTGVRMLGLEAKPYINSINSLEKEEGPLEELDEWISMLERDFPGYPDAAYARARYDYRRRMFAQALEQFDRAVKRSAVYDGADCDSVGAEMERIDYFRGLCKWALGDAVGALDLFADLSRHAKNNAAMLRMLAIVKPMGDLHADAFAQDFFLSLDDAVKPQMLGAVMMYYMSKPATFGYAYMRDRQGAKDIDATLSGFIQAGNGDYLGASNFFYLNAVGAKNKDSAMRALLCAVLAQNADALEHAKSVAPPCQQAALGVADAPVAEDDIPQIASLVVEADRLRGGALSAQIARTAAEQLGTGLAQAFAEQLEKSFAYSAALAAVEAAPLSPETVFLRGYYTCRLGRMGEAEDLLRLAKAQGADGPAADGMLESAEKRLRAFRADKQPDMAAEQARVAAHLERGDFHTAQAALAVLRDLAEPDAPWYSMAAVTAYYLGQDERAALIVRAGLLRFPDDADLLYNAGDIYSRMGLKKCSKIYYEQALERCGDEALREQIRAALVSMPA